MPSKNPPGIALGCNDLRCFLTDVFRQTTRGRRQLLQRHVILIIQIALSIAGSGPSSVFGECISCVVFLQLGYQPKDEAVELHVRHGQCRLTAYQQSRRRIGCQAIEIRIVQYFDSFFRFLQ